MQICKLKMAIKNLGGSSSTPALTPNIIYKIYILFLLRFPWICARLAPEMPQKYLKISVTKFDI